MIEEEKILYQITTNTNNKKDDIVLDWGRIPNKLLTKIPSKLLYTELAYSEKDGLTLKTVAHFKKVKKFKKGVEKSDIGNNIILGV